VNIRITAIRHDNIDFIPIVTKISKIKSLSAVVADKGYDNENNHIIIIIREKLNGFSVISSRYANVPIWKTHGRYRKKMKRVYNKILYNQRNKDETIIIAIKRLFDEHVTSKLIQMQKTRELTFRCIAYNVHRMLNLIIIRWFLQSLVYYLI